MIFRMVQAEFGDCMILETSDSDGTMRNILIDGGPATIYDEHLKMELDAISHEGGKLDLVVLSHVDADHIVGLLDLFSDLLQNPFISIDKLWHNSFDKAFGGQGEVVPRLHSVVQEAGMQGVQLANAEEVSIQSINQGNRLRIRAQQLNIPINPDIQGGLLKATSKPYRLKIGGITLTVVGPTTTNLNALKKEWIKWLDKQELAMATADMETFAMADESIPNLSSICLLAEAEGRRILLTGDARGDHILQGLKLCKLLQPDGTMEVDVFKVPHHGSDRNVTLDFFRKIKAKTYVISANGKYGNPDYDTLKWIITVAKIQQRSIEIVCSNLAPSVRQIQQDFPLQENTYSIRVLEEGAHSILV